MTKTITRMTRPTLGALVAIAMVTASCGDRGRTEVSGGEVARGTTRVADIVSQPERFTGRTVTVEADVDKVLSPFAFTLDEDSPLAGGIDRDLIVAYPRSLALEPLDGSWRGNKVRVRGTMRRMTVAEFERELGRDLQPALEVEFMKQPVLVARSVERVR
jgi:hypothetical protein